MGTTKELTKPSSVTTDGLETRTESREIQSTPESERAIAEIRGAILMARHFPRDTDLAISNINKLCRRMRFADGAFYAFPRGGKEVQGPSVNLARGIAAEWGNIDYGKRIILDDGEEIVIEAYAWDMERNSKVRDQASFKCLIQRKDKKSGETRWVTPDERDKRELVNKHGAIAERNCLLKILPRDVVDQAFDMCRKTVAEGAGVDREEVIRNMMTDFSEIGVSKQQIESWLADKRDDETADIRSAVKEEFVELRGILNSIRDGNSSPSDHFTKTKTATHEKGTLDPSQMKAGDGKTNTGFENAPKGTGQETLV